MSKSGIPFLSKYLSGVRARSAKRSVGVGLTQEASFTPLTLSKTCLVIALRCLMERTEPNQPRLHVGQFSNDLAPSGLKDTLTVRKST